jgi:hypothetical protein
MRARHYILDQKFEKNMKNLDEMTESELRDLRNKINLRLKDPDTLNWKSLIPLYIYSLGLFTFFAILAIFY